MGTSAPGLLGRSAECGLLDGMLVAARSGESAVVVIRGEAGVGKTALLRYAADRAAAMRVEEVTGVQAEMELPFAGVGVVAPARAKGAAMTRGGGA